MKTDFPLDFYNEMIAELRLLKQDKSVAYDSASAIALTCTISVLMNEIEWYTQRKWYTEEEVREEFGKAHPITDRSVLAWEELENMLLGEQLDYMAEHLGFEYNEKVGMWT